jgi:hypothetical protein
MGLFDSIIAINVFYDMNLITFLKHCTRLGASRAYLVALADPSLFSSDVGIIKSDRQRFSLRHKQCTISQLVNNKLITETVNKNTVRFRDMTDNTPAYEHDMQNIVDVVSIRIVNFDN